MSKTIEKLRLNKKVESIIKDANGYVITLQGHFDEKQGTVIRNLKTAHEVRLRIQAAKQIPENHIVKQNLMSHTYFTIEQGTSLACDPSSETYWSM